MENPRRILVKALRLQKAFNMYDSKNEDYKNEALTKFEAVWGITLANHFLGKYGDAESLIFALDDDNLKLFIEKF